MKQTISVFLLIAMFASFCLVSCGGSDAAENGTTKSESATSSDTDAKPNEETVAADPYGWITGGLYRALADFFEDEAGLYGTVSQTVGQGALSLSFAHETLLGDVKRITETFYMNDDERKYVSQTQVLMNRQLLSALLFFDRNGLSLKSQAVLGSSKTLEIDLTDFAQSFGNSAAAELSGLNEEMLSLIAHYAVLFDECYQELFEESTKDVEALMAEIGIAFSQSVSRTEKTDEVLVSYRIDNKSLHAFLDTLLEYLEIGEETVTFIREQTAAFLGQYDAVLRTDFLLDTANGSMKLAMLQGMLTTADGEQITVDLSLRFTGEQIKLTLSFLSDNNPYFAELIWTRREDSGVISYGVTLDTELGGIRERLVDAEYIYDVGGGVKITATLYPDGSEPMDVSLLGQITVGEDAAIIEFHTLSYKSVQMLFDASVTFTPNATAPEKPEDTVDVVQMTEKDWNAVVEELKGSIIGKLIFGEENNE
ncbi:MAG: hypothetical protein IJX80_07535 [Clostridia bacterium]|nr:hypothetical protein [Clostridia bacterium]